MPLIRRGSSLVFFAALYSFVNSRLLRPDLKLFSGKMQYRTLFEGKTPFNKLWPLLDLRAELELRLTNTNSITQKLRYPF